VNDKNQGFQITLREIYEILIQNKDRLRDLENKVEKNSLPNKDVSNLEDKDDKLELMIKELSYEFDKLESKIDNHIERLAGITEGTNKTHNTWIKILSLIIALLSIVQLFSIFS